MAVKGGFDAYGVGSDIGNGVKNVGSFIGNGVKGIGSGIYNGAKGIGSGVYNGAKGIGSGVYNGVKNVGSFIGNGAKGIGSGIYNGAKGIGSGIYNGAKGVNDFLGNGVKNVGSFIGNGVKGTSKLLKSMMAMSPLGLASMVDSKIIREFNESEAGKEFNKDPKKAASKYFALGTGNIAAANSSSGSGTTRSGSISNNSGASSSGSSLYSGSNQSLISNIKEGIISGLSEMAISGNIGNSGATSNSSGGTGSNTSSSAVTNSGNWQWPVDGYGLVEDSDGLDSSGFGERHMGYGSTYHDGVDIASPYGSPCYAVGDGTITYSGDYGNYQLYIQIDHGNGILTFYGHMSASNVNVGDTVKKGQQIGSTGNGYGAYGAHLHLGLHVNGEMTDPLSLWNYKAPVGNTPSQSISKQGTSTIAGTSSASSTNSTATPVSSAVINNTNSSTNSTATTSTATTSSTLQGTTNKQKIWSFFKGKGFSDAGTAGIIGNLMQESTCNPSAVENDGAGPGHGLAQWTGSRWDGENGLAAYAASKGASWDDLNTQLDFLWEEIVNGGQYLGDLDALKNATDINTAADLFEAAFERARTPMMEKRYKEAQKAYEECQGIGAGDTGSSASGTGSNLSTGTGKTGSGNTYLEFVRKTKKSSGIFDKSDEAYWGSTGTKSFNNMTGAEKITFDSDGRIIAKGSSSSTSSGSTGSSATGTGSSGSSGTSSGSTGTSSGSSGSTVTNNGGTTTITNPSTGSVIVNCQPSDAFNTKQAETLVNGVNNISTNSDKTVSLLTEILSKIKLTNEQKQELSSLGIDTSNIEYLLMGN